MPPDPQPGRLPDLPERFLDAVLAEVGEAGAGACFDGGQGERLGDGDEPDAARVPAGAGRRAGDAVTDRPDVGAERGGRRGGGQRARSRSAMREAASAACSPAGRWVR